MLKTETRRRLRSFRKEGFLTNKLQDATGENVIGVYDDVMYKQVYGYVIIHVERRIFVMLSKMR